MKSSPARTETRYTRSFRLYLGVAPYGTFTSRGNGRPREPCLMYEISSTTVDNMALVLAYVRVKSWCTYHVDSPHRHSKWSSACHRATPSATVYCIDVVISLGILYATTGLQSNLMGLHILISSHSCMAPHIAAATGRKECAPLTPQSISTFKNSNGVL